jgi:hypothetical protein
MYPSSIEEFVDKRHIPAAMGGMDLYQYNIAHYAGITCDIGTRCLLD